MTIASVLFLDDSHWRHSAFTEITDLLRDVRVSQAFNAATAIELLESQTFDQVFLDHDLDERDIMVPVGAASCAPTGMDVVDHILTMTQPPRRVIVHSCNAPAAHEMVARLQTHPAGINAREIAFPALLAYMTK